MYYIIRGRKILNNCIQDMKDRFDAGGKEFLVEIKPHDKARSIAQNRLMWLWYGVIGKDMGFETDYLHSLMKKRVLGWKEISIDGERFQQLNSTTDLTTKQMTEFLEAIESLAVELNIVLPYPQDYGYAMGTE